MTSTEETRLVTKKIPVAVSILFFPVSSGDLLYDSAHASVELAQWSKQDDTATGRSQRSEATKSFELRSSIHFR
jgi:hypothetical protein